MTKPEFDEMAALVVRLRKDVELHTEALKQSNAQCSKLLVQNEQLTAELDRMKGDPLPIKLVGKLKDVETSNKTLHSELVEVRAALASVSAERDSLKRTLKEWEEAETKPQQRIPQVGFIQDDDAYFGVKLSVYGNDKKRNRKPAADIADHVVPPVVPMPAESIPLCMTCHECECELRINNHGAPGCFCGDCERMSQTVKNIAYWAVHSHPYYGPCPSKTKVRHE